MTGNTVGYQMRSDRLARLAIVLAMIAAIFIVVPPAQGAAVSGTVDFVLATSSAPEGTTPHTLDVVLSLPNTLDTLDAGFTVDVAVVVATPGTATGGGVDYTYSTTTVTFATGDADQTTKPVNVTIVDDVLDEAPETIELELTNLLGGTSSIGVVQPTHQVTITDNDPTPSLSVSNAAAVTEGVTASFTVSLSAASGQTVTVDYATANGTAIAPGDYTAIGTTTLTFTPGQTSKTVNVTTIDDTLDESTETFTVELTNVSATATILDGSGLGTINDNDGAPTVSVSNAAAVTEGVTASFTVSLSAASGQTVTVDYATANGTAIAPGDYTAIGTTTLTFTPGQTSKTVNVTTIDDTLDESTETFTVELTNVSATATILDGSGLGTINDDPNDLPPTVSIADGSAVEGNGTVSFNISLSAASGKPVTVDYTTANVTAIAPGDYTAKTGQVVFAPGETTKAISVVIINDTRDEPDVETFNVGLTLPPLSNASPGDMTGVGTINDDDPTPTLSVNSVSVEEGLIATFTVTLSAASNQTVTVNYLTANGTAVAPGDYTAKTSTLLTFTPGQTTKTVDVATVEDLFNEANETFTLELSGVGNATIPVPSGTGTILNDDGPPGLSVIDATPAAEGSVGVVFTVSLLPASGQTVTVKYATASGTALVGSDFTAKTGTLTFPAGTTSQKVTVPIINDSLDEVTEIMLLNLSGATNAGIVDAQGVGTILDNDNVAPDVVNARTTDAGGNPGFSFRTGETVKILVDFTDPGLADAHGVILDWGDGTAPTSFALTPAGARSFERTHTYAGEGLFQISVTVNDGDGGSDTNQAFVTVSTGAIGDGDDTVGLVDPTRSVWRLYNDLGVMVTEFYYGNPGDYPFMGDWDGDGIDTPGLYRQSDGFVYLRNSNTQGLADIQFYFGNPGDVPIAGDFNNDGKDTVSIYRPSNQTFYIINELGANGGGLGASDFSYVFGDPGDKPFVGDFDGDGIDTVGLHRESTGLVYFRNTHTQGNADNQFIFGDPGDQLIAGDWTLDGIDTPALYRSSDQTVYWRFTNTQGNADATFDTGLSGWIPVAGVTGV